MPPRSSPTGRQVRPPASACRAPAWGRTRAPTPSRPNDPANVLDECFRRPVAVARGVFDLGADLAERFALPSHFARREMPDRIAGHVAWLEVRRLVADRTAHGRKTVSVRAAFDRRLMQPCGVALARTVAGGMTVEAARVGQHFAELDEHGRRPRRRVADAGEALRCGEFGIRQARQSRRRTTPQPLPIPRCALSISFCDRLQSRRSREIASGIREDHVAHRLVIFEGRCPAALMLPGPFEMRPDAG
jgi:hypothetical protein